MMILPNVAEQKKKDSLGSFGMVPIIRGAGPDVDEEPRRLRLAEDRPELPYAADDFEKGEGNAPRIAAQIQVDRMRDSSVSTQP